MFIGSDLFRLDLMGRLPALAAYPAIPGSVCFWIPKACYRQPLGSSVRTLSWQSVLVLCEGPPVRHHGRRHDNRAEKENPPPASESHFGFSFRLGPGIEIVGSGPDNVRPTRLHGLALAIAEQSEAHRPGQKAARGTTMGLT